MGFFSWVKTDYIVIRPASFLALFLFNNRLVSSHVIPNIDNLPILKTYLNFCLKHPIFAALKKTLSLYPCPVAKAIVQATGM